MASDNPGVTLRGDLMRPPSSSETIDGVAGSHDAADLPSTPRRAPWSPARVATAVMVIGVGLTLGVSWTASVLNHNNTYRLLDVETRQAGDVLAGTILEIRNPLLTSLQIAEATG